MNFENNKIIFISSLLLILAVNIYMYYKEKDCKYMLNKKRKQIKVLKQRLSNKTRPGKTTTFVEEGYQDEYQDDESVDDDGSFFRIGKYLYDKNEVI